MSNSQLVTRSSLPGKKILVTGPSKSGKSRWAESLISSSESITYIATGIYDCKDKDWLEKIRIHKLRRPKTWNLVESSKDLCSYIQKLNGNLIIDSLGGFVSVHLNKTEVEWREISFELIEAVKNSRSLIVIVIEQTGWSIVPATRLGILFSDRLGELSQHLDLISDESWLVLQNRAINITEVSERVP